MVLIFEGVINFRGFRGFFFLNPRKFVLARIIIAIDSFIFNQSILGNFEANSSVLKAI